MAGCGDVACSGDTLKRNVRRVGLRSASSSGVTNGVGILGAAGVAPRGRLGNDDDGGADSGDGCGGCSGGDAGDEDKDDADVDMCGPNGDGLGVTDNGGDDKMGGDRSLADVVVACAVLDAKVGVVSEIWSLTARGACDGVAGVADVATVATAPAAPAAVRARAAGATGSMAGTGAGFLDANGDRTDGRCPLAATPRDLRVGVATTSGMTRCILTINGTATDVKRPVVIPHSYAADSSASEPILPPWRYTRRISRRSSRRPRYTLQRNGGGIPGRPASRDRSLANAP